MKKSTSLRKIFGIGGIFAMLFLTTLSCFGAINLPDWFDGGGNLLAGFAFGASGFIDSQGNWISNARGSSSDPQAVQIMNSLVGASNCGADGNYKAPDQVTFTFTNAALTEEIVKFTQADDMYEATNGEIGAAGTASWFDILELPFGDGTIVKQDGTDIFAAQTLAQTLQTYGLMIGKIQVSGSAISGVNATSSFTIKAFATDLTGPRGDNWKLEVDTNNAQSAIPTLTLIKDIALTSNVTFYCTVPPSSSIQITMFVKGTIIYI